MAVDGMGGGFLFCTRKCLIGGRAISLYSDCVYNRTGQKPSCAAPYEKCGWQALSGLYSVDTPPLVKSIIIIIIIPVRPNPNDIQD